ncbi:replication protein [Geomicrobium sp. JCM 19055]|uniref:replication protein n=1 Tax=Geomicrobium sp. JCM 19055 TaxID=1460649 RepID=UPI00045EDDF8|nr:replication protein [Geomicrobium sp. JCM 19055]GAK01484.1 hypothetical protein JCM19055_4650 [Geomicrobium sp. JCM 19055]
MAANPQAENGYTRVANEIMEVVQEYKFSANELKIILCIWRYTYGFQRKEHSISLSFF